MRQNTSITVIACGIFADELQAVLAGKKTLADIIWIEPDLHTDLKQLEAKINTTLAEAADTIHSPCILFGSGCLTGITDILQRHGARTLPANNCIDAGIHPLTDEDVLGFFDLTGLVVEIFPLDLSHFSSLIDKVISLQYSLKEPSSIQGDVQYSNY